MLASCWQCRAPKNIFFYALAKLIFGPGLSSSIHQPRSCFLFSNGFTPRLNLESHNYPSRTIMVSRFTGRPRLRPQLCHHSMWLINPKAKMTESHSEGIRIKTFYPAVDRIVVIGDVHGDARALRQCLDYAGLLTENGNWGGGSTHLVQIGDILDRGEEERACLDLLLKLQAQASAVGGAVHMLLGNHEIMNADLEFSYVGPGAWTGWEDDRPKDYVEAEEDDARRKNFLVQREAEPVGVAVAAGGCRERSDSRARGLRGIANGLVALVSLPLQLAQTDRSRAEAFRPGGHFAVRMARMPVCVQIGDTVLVHGGLQESHLEMGLEDINRRTACWLMDKGPRPRFLSGPNSPLWMRNYSAPTLRPEASAELDKVLGRLGAQRMVVGHTPQLKGINMQQTDSGREIWRCDTGMSSAMMAGPVECLEIRGDGSVHVLTKFGPLAAALRSGEVVGDAISVCDMDAGLCTPLSPPPVTRRHRPHHLGEHKAGHVHKHVYVHGHAHGSLHPERRGGGERGGMRAGELGDKGGFLSTQGEWDVEAEFEEEGSEAAAAAAAAAVAAARAVEERMLLEAAWDRDPGSFLGE